MSVRTTTLLFAGVAALAIGAFLSPAGRAQPPVIPNSLPANTVETPLPTPPDEPDRVTVTGMVPIPDVGEPVVYYSPDDIAALQREARNDMVDAEKFARKCNVDPGMPPEGWSIGSMFVREAEAARKVANTSIAARNATLAAEEARSKAARGEIDMKTVEAAELARQVAVKAFDEARFEEAEAKAATSDVLWLNQRKTPREHVYTEIGRLAWERKKAGGARAVRPALELADLELADIRLNPGIDKKGRYIKLTGRIINTRPNAIQVPAITVTAVDRRGLPLESKVAEKRHTPEIPAGSSIIFNYEFRPAPAAANSLIVSFASKDTGALRLPPGMFEECRPGG